MFDVETGSFVTKLTARDAFAVDQFGRSVGIFGSTAIVGSLFDDDAGISSGSAYLFDTTNGMQLAKLRASDASTQDQFGTSVAISGTTAIVGSPFDDDAGSRSGSAYVFDVASRTQRVKLTAEDAARGDRFGTSVAISGTTTIIGAPFDANSRNASGSAHLFDANTGAQLAKLSAKSSGNADRFGSAVAIAESLAIVGSPGSNGSGNDSGSAFVFDARSGAQIAKLVAKDAAQNDGFGSSVAISGRIAIVGSAANSDLGSNSGSAYVFDALTGRQIAKLTAGDGAANDLFGGSVAVSEEFALIGSRGDNSSSGSVYQLDTATLAPIPLPSGVWLLGSAILGFGSIRRRPGRVRSSILVRA